MPAISLSPDNCPGFEGCDAPLCPLASELERCIWYPDEAICQRRDMRFDWVRKQKLIAKRHSSVDGFFTVGALMSLRRVSKRTKGTDPDSRSSLAVSSGGLVALRKNIEGENHRRIPVRAASRGSSDA